MICFSALTPACKNKNQRLVEELKQKRGLGFVGDDGKVTFGVIPDPNGENESEDDSEDDEDEV